MALRHLTVRIMVLLGYKIPWMLINMYWIRPYAFTAAVFVGARSAFRLLITCAVRRHGFLLRNLPHGICRPYHATSDRADSIAFSQILDVQTLDQVNCAKRRLSLRAEFRGLNVRSIELDVKHAHYASFTATLSNMITDHESELISHMYSHIRHKLPHVATFTLPWAVQLRDWYDTISNMNGFSESYISVLTNTLNQCLSDYVGPDVEVVLSPVENVAASATHLTCLQ
jgi:hypothetical protein